MRVAARPVSDAGAIARRFDSAGGSSPKEGSAMVDNNGFKLSRRKILAGLGSIGVASAGVGLGTSAYFSDEEDFANNQLVAGELDMKVGYSAHYSDWKPNENGTPEDEGVEVRMWGGAPNTTGGPADLNGDEYGLPTNAAWLLAVSPDGSTTTTRDEAAERFLDNTQYSDPEVDGASCEDGNEADDLEAPVVELEDVKPGDFGEVTFDFALCDNPGFVWLQGALQEAAENGYTEPERKDPQEDGPDNEDTVELLDVVQVALWIDDGNDYQNGDEMPFFVGSLRDAMVGELGEATPPGVPLPGDIPAEEGGGMGDRCFSAEAEHSVAFAWWVPIDHGNEIQTDSATFELGLYTEQCRHNERTSTIELPAEENYIGYEDRPASGDFDYNDFGMDADITEMYVDGELQEIEMEFTSRVYEAGDNHLIHIERTLPSDVSYGYTVSRSGPGDTVTSDVTAAGMYSDSGDLDVVLYDTGPLSNGDSTSDTVEVSVNITSGSVGQPTSSPRPDVAANNPLFEVYDPYMMNTSRNNRIDLETVQENVDKSATDWDGQSDVPNIIVVPETGFAPPDEQVTITNDYPEFDDYYQNVDDDGDVDPDSNFDDWFNP
jgi:LruC domain-containing protein/predicted ribosomally synthesized peptide with SipW-like signal peptide